MRDCCGRRCELYGVVVISTWMRKYRCEDGTCRDYLKSGYVAKGGARKILGGANTVSLTYGGVMLKPTPCNICWMMTKPYKSGSISSGQDGEQNNTRTIIIFVHQIHRTIVRIPLSDSH